LANSFSHFEQRCLEAIAAVEPMGCNAPVGVHAVLCDAVRLARECADNGIGSMAGAGWQQADTAPKDGTPILAHERNRPNRIAVVRWQYLTHEDRSAGGWWSTIPACSGFKPDFWMPLPEPPK
jgi:hypothetical protein